MSNASTPDRAKAYRIRQKRKSGEDLEEDEIAWLEEYESNKTEKNRSASSRVVHLDIEEKAVAEGEHLHPDAYANLARADGLRADTLMRIVTDRLMQCNDHYMKLMMFMMERSVKLEEKHIELLEAVRLEHIARTEAEAETRMVQSIKDAAGEDDELGQMLGFVMEAIKARGQQPQSKKKVKKKSSKPLGEVG